MKTMDDADRTEQAPASSVSSPGRRPNNDVRAGLAVGLILLGVYLFTMGGHTYSVDGETYLAGTRALFNRTTVLRPGTDLDAVVITVPNKNGDPTTAAPIGTLLLFAPGFAAGKVIAAPFALQSREEIVRLIYLSTNSLLTAATGVVLFFLCRRLGAKRSSAMLLALTYGLGTWAWAHSQTDFSEPGTALMVTASLLAAVRWWDTRTVRAGALAGFLAGCAALTRVSTVLFVPVLLLSGIVALSNETRRDRMMHGLAFCCGGIIPALALAVNAWVRFGSPLDSGYPPMSYAAPMYEGIFGLFASPGKGILLYAPVCIVVLFALRTSYLMHRRYALTVGAILCAHVLVYARFDVWSGENAFGPRYLIPVLPIIVALLAPVIDTGRQWVRGVQIAAVIGFIVPGLLGSLLYFNAVYFTQQPGVLSDMNLTTATQTQQYNAWNFLPRSSPLILDIRSVPNLVRNTVARLKDEPAGITPIPAPYEERIHWYARAVELDTWWAWWPTKNASSAFLLLLAVPVLSLGFGIRLARRTLRSGIA